MRRFLAARSTLSSMVSTVLAIGDKSEAQLPCLFDTGATESFILRSVADRLTSIVKLPQPYEIRFGDNRTVRVEDVAVLALDVAGQTVMDTFLVLDEMVHEVILGESTMRKYGLKIDMEHSVIFSALKKESFMKDFVKKVFALLKISPEKDEVSEEEALALIQKKVEEDKPKGVTVVASKEILSTLELAENATEAEVKGKILALKHPGNVVSREEHAALEARFHEQEVVSAVDKAIGVDKKLYPHEREWALEQAKKDLPAFQAFVANRPVVAPIDIKLENKDDKTLAAGRIDDVQKAVNAQLGVKDDLFQKYNPAQ